MTFAKWWSDPWLRVGLSLMFYSVIVIALIQTVDYCSSHQEPSEEDLAIKRKARRLRALRAKIKQNRVRK